MSAFEIIGIFIYFSISLVACIVSYTKKQQGCENLYFHLAFTFLFFPMELMFKSLGSVRG